MSHYESETRVTRIAEGKYRSYVSGNWNIGDNPNGGYLISIALRAISDVLPHPDPVTVTTHYLRPGMADQDCDIHVSIIRTGRTMSTARATLIQGNKARLEVLATFGDLEQSAGVQTNLSIPAPELPSPENCVQRSGDLQGIDLPISSRLDTRLHPDPALAGTGGKAEISGYIRFLDGTPPNAHALLQFADAFPPSPFSLLGVVGWVPTVELTVHVRRKPAPGFITARLSTNDLYMGRMIEDGLLWDSTGQLVAQSRQLGLVMSGD